MRNPAFCICENKSADQLQCNRVAYQRLCFTHIDSAIPILPNPKFQVSSYLLWQPRLCWNWWETPKTVFSHDDAQL